MLVAMLLAGLLMGQAGEGAWPSGQAAAPSPQFERDTAAGRPPPGDRGLLMGLFEETPLGDWLARNRFRISGWTEVSLTPSNVTGDILPMGFNYRGNEFLLQQNWLRIDLAVDPESERPSFGFRSDTILPGTDYRFSVARGLGSGQLTADDGQPNLYGFDPIQFYAEASLPGVRNGLNVKLGRFFAPYGVESVAAAETPLGSRAYTFIYDPFTTTGLSTRLKWDDTWSFENGIVLGDDVFIDPAASPHFIGGVRWAPPGGPASLALTMLLGKGRYDVPEAFHNPQVFDLVYTRTLSGSTTWTFNVLYGVTSNVPGIGFANWFGIVNYLTRTWSDRFSATGRLEFFNDLQGQRTGFAGLYTAATVGVTYKPRPRLWLRPELRLDHNDSRPFQGHSTLFTAGLDAILRW